MSSIPPKKTPAPTQPDKAALQRTPLLQGLDRALESKDEANLNLLLFQVTHKAGEHPGELQQVFRHLHEAMHNAARHGKPLNHKEEVASFLSKQGQQRLVSLIKEILNPVQPKQLQQNIGEAKWLLASGYGGKNREECARAIGLRSFGEANQAANMQQQSRTGVAAKRVVKTIKDALTPAASQVSPSKQGPLNKASTALQQVKKLVPGRSNKD